MYNPQKILIVRFSSIGDIVLASPLIRALRAKFPQAQIDFLVKTEYADLVRFNHHLSSTIELSRPDVAALRHVHAVVRKERYDVILDIHNSLRSRAVRLLSGAKKTFVIDKQVLARFMLIHFKWNLYHEVMPVAERYLKTATPLGVRNDGKGLEVFIPDETLFAVSSMMSKYRLDRSDAVIGIAPSARHFTKMWLQERFIEVAIETARNYNGRVLLFGGTEDVVRCATITERVNETLGRAAAVNLAGKLSLLETAAALDVCDVVLSNDTGIMHLAAARQRNVVAIFGPTVREFGFFPYGTHADVIEHPDLACRPCTHIGSQQCPQGHFRCMNDISAQRVTQSVSTMLVTHLQHKPA